MDSIGMLYSLGYLRNELQTANQAIKELQSQLHQCREREKKMLAVVEAAKPAAVWMQEWLEQGNCECEGRCNCGYSEREKELEALQTALTALDSEGVE